MAQENEVTLRDIEIGFTRKSDGKIVNVKLLEIFKQLKNADFINNEIKINGETLIADSFRTSYSEVILNVQKNNLNNGDGSYRINDQVYTENKTFNVEKNAAIQTVLIPNQDSLIKSVIDENNVNLEPVDNTVILPTDTDHTITINYDLKEIIQDRKSVV